ncbi:hypothetical protein HanXRQr2_Chr07g0301801 [Helianthus annuus]|uniref:Uncharacterized protein n=1 Tax=Helianthus annuus TaxID=4232 RepID=A0A9K3IMJ4_HELAN|nr:hypothetical protein HanXRQr2_Chr07g0301801 [Helianthus annuus]
MWKFKDRPMTLWVKVVVPINGSSRVVGQFPLKKTVFVRCGKTFALLRKSFML